MQLHFIKLFWLTSSWNLTQDNGPFISSRLFMMHLFLFFPTRYCLWDIFYFCITAVFRRPISVKGLMSITTHFAGTGLRQLSYGQTQGTPVKPATWKKLASTCINMMSMTETRHFDLTVKNTSFLLQGLRWYKMPTRDPPSLGLYTAENLVPICKVRRAKGHWRSQKPRVKCCVSLG